MNNSYLQVRPRLLGGFEEQKGNGGCFTSTQDTAESHCWNSGNFSENFFHLGTALVIVAVVVFAYFMLALQAMDSGKTIEHKPSKSDLSQELRPTSTTKSKNNASTKSTVTKEKV